MKALVTGSRGFVGRHMVPALEAAGYAVTEVDLKMGTAYDCRRWFAESTERFDLVVHLAALVGGRSTIEGSAATLAAWDLSCDAEMFAWALRTWPGKVVYFSSSAAYPTAYQVNPGTRLVERDIDVAYPMPPDMSYGWTKLTGERLAAWARDEAGLDIVVFRPFSGYGADQDLDYPFPSYIARALARHGETAATPFDIWGDGTQTRDFIHIDDVVAGVLATIDAGHPGPLNLGTGRSTSFNELAALVCGLAGYELEVVQHLTDRPTGPSHRVADVTEMRKVYEPRISLEDGIAEALRQGGR